MKATDNELYSDQRQKHTNDKLYIRGKVTQQGIGLGEQICIKIAR